MRIGIDLDGCVHDYVGSFTRYLRHIGHEGPLPVPASWNIWESWNMTQDEWRAHFIRGAAAGIIFGVGEPHKGAKDALDALSKQGHTLHIITDRLIHPRAAESTVDWLHDHGIGFDSLTFAADKTIVPTDIFIEDRVENADRLFAVGTPAILMDRPWNHFGHWLPRVSSWPEFVAKVAEREAELAA